MRQEKSDAKSECAVTVKGELQSNRCHDEDGVHGQESIAKLATQRPAGHVQQQQVCDQRDQQQQDCVQQSLGLDLNSGARLNDDRSQEPWTTQAEKDVKDVGSNAVADGHVSMTGHRDAS